MKSSPKFKSGDPVTWVDDAEGTMKRYFGRIVTADEETGDRVYLIHLNLADFQPGVMAKDKAAPFAIAIEDELSLLRMGDD